MEAYFICPSREGEWPAEPSVPATENQFKCLQQSLSHVLSERNLPSITAALADQSFQRHASGPRKARVVVTTLETVQQHLPLMK